MNVSKVIETPEGTVKFEGELGPKELDLVLEIGLNYLLQQGALPLINGEEGASLQLPPSNSEQ